MDAKPKARRLGILASHPVQYQAPWFRALANKADLHVFFAHRQTAPEQGKAGFGVAFDWDVDLLSGYRNTFLPNVARKPSVNHFLGCDTPEIRKIIFEAKFDAFIVMGWYLKSYWQAIRACRREGTPVLVRGDSHLNTPRSPLKRWAKKILYRPLLRQFDGFLVVGRRNREYLAHYGTPEGKMFFAPHFVDSEWFRSKAADLRSQKSEVRSGWGADKRTLVALFVGKLHAIKRPQDILKALGKLRGRDVNALGVFVGSGEMETVLRELASSVGVSARFEGFKNQSELPSYYAAADVLVLPSSSETWGLVVNEAMECGLPAIVSDAVGCAPDLIENGLTGFTFRVSDIDALTSRLIEMDRLREKKHDFTDALRMKMDIYSVEAAVQGTLRATHQLSAARPSPPRW